jgi:hypothetical protein
VAEFKHGQDGDCVVGIGMCHGEQYGDLDGTYLVGDWISGRIWGLGRNSGKSDWAMQELLHTQLQLTCGGEDEKGDLYVANATSQYGAYKDPFSNPPGSVWRVVAADKVPAGAKTAPVR